MNQFDNLLNNNDNELDYLDCLLFSYEQTSNNQFLVFHTCKGTLYAIALSYVRELVDARLMKVSTNPNPNSLFFATANLRDKMFPMLIGDSYFESKIDETLNYRTALIIEYNSKSIIMLLNEIDNLMTIKNEAQFDNHIVNLKSSTIAKIDLENEEVLCNIIDVSVLFETLGL